MLLSVSACLPASRRRRRSTLPRFHDHPPQAWRHGGRLDGGICIFFSREFSGTHLF
nr:MAG TPA: hypothetical protein [Bacteriophage sp.]